MGSAENYHSLIRDAANDGKIKIGYNIWAINSPQSPVYRAYENGIPGLIITLLVIYNFIAGGLIWGFVSLISGILFFVVFIRTWIVRRVSARTTALVMADAQNWEQFWSMGAISIRLLGDLDEECFSPVGDWKEFARRNLIDRPRSNSS